MINDHINNMKELTDEKIFGMQQLAFFACLETLFLSVVSQPQTNATSNPSR